MGNRLGSMTICVNEGMCNSVRNDAFGSDGFSALCPSHADMVGSQDFYIRKAPPFKPPKRTRTTPSNSSGAALWKDKAHMDFVVASGETQVNCHRCVLAAASPVFQRMFQSDMQESRTGSIEINDVSPDAVAAMLRFAYFNDIEDSSDAVVHELI